VCQRDRLGQVLVQSQRAGEGARDARDLDRVGHPRAIMIARPIKEDLRLVFEPPEGTAVDDPVAVALKSSAELVQILGMRAPPRGRAALRAGRQMTRLALLQIKSASRHAPKCHLAPRDSTECSDFAGITISAMEKNGNDLGIICVRTSGYFDDGMMDFWRRRGSRIICGSRN
jgi:hypothetical protein